MKSIIYCIAIFIATFVLFGCNSNSTQRTEGNDTIPSDSDTTDCNCESDIIHHKLSYYDFDKVSDLSVFFDTIITNHHTYFYDYYDEKDADDKVKDCIAQIDRYRKGECKFFPDSAVSTILSVLGHQYAKISNHGGDIDMKFSEWFMMCAAYYTPDITCLVDTQTPDHQAGYLNLGKSYNYNPWWSYMFVKRQKGFEVIRVDGDEVDLTGVYQFDDDKRQRYYLFSNNKNTDEFNQQLYYRDGENIVKVAECKEFYKLEDGHDFLYFDKEKRVWSPCTTDKDFKVYTPIEGAEKVKLVLNGRNSRFEHSKDF